MQSNLAKIRRRLSMDWFLDPGAYVSVDGQYGSTGKGVINAALAEMFFDRVDVVTSNASPNSGHTSYYNDEQIVLKQLPTFGVIANKISLDKIGLPHSAPDIFLNDGAIINRQLLDKEIEQYTHGAVISVGGRAAIITSEALEKDQSNVKNIASTGQGIGPALQAKLGRDRHAVWDARKVNPPFAGVVFVEVSQGFSLGINQAFYPNVTTRECTVGQAMADAGLHPKSLRKTVMSVRTFPIRVGDTENSSGDCYPDQFETNFEALGQEPEYTTVTKRQRRIFTWSQEQFEDSIIANRPDVIFLNFVNYLKPDMVNGFVVDNIFKPYRDTFGRAPDAIILGYGPKSSDLELWEA